MQESKSPFAGPLDLALSHTLEHLQGLDQRPVSAVADLQQVRRRLRKPLNDEPLPAEAVVEELVRDAKDGIVGCAGGRFFAWVIGGSLPAALAADWLTSGWDQNAALYAASPSAAVVEEVAGEWLKELLGIPPAASFALVSGCQMAHATCLAAARNAVLADRAWDVERRGLAGAPPIRIFSSPELHGSVERAIRLLGLGLDSITHLPLDEYGRVPADALESALARHSSGPAIVLLQAGDINTGAYDDFRSLIPVAKRHQAWVHVDGAFGLWAAATPRYRHLLDGCDQADSWATDGHKWLNVPYDCGYAFVARPDAHRAAMSHRAPYLIHALDARDQMDWNPEWSRRARGFPTYAAIRQLGRSGLAALIEQCCDAASRLVEELGRLPGVEVLWRPIINQGLVRFLSPQENANEQDHDAYTDRVIAAVVADGGAFFGGTTWRGRRAMRVSVCNWQTTAEHVATAVSAVGRILTTDRDQHPA